MGANKIMEEKLRVELKEGETELTMLQQEDLEKTAEECKSRWTEVKGLLQTALWDSFCNGKMSTPLKAAYQEYKCTATMEPSDNQEGYEFMLNPYYCKLTSWWVGGWQHDKSHFKECA